MRQVVVCIALMSKPYVIWHLEVGLAVKAMSDSAEGIGISFDISNIRKVKKFFLRQKHLVCGKVAGDMKLARSDIQSGFAVVSWCFCGTSLCIGNRSEGAFNRMFRRIFFIEKLVLWPSQLWFSGLEPLLTASKRHECFWQMKMMFHNDSGIGYCGCSIDLWSTAAFWRRAFAYVLVGSSPTA